MVLFVCFLSDEKDEAAICAAETVVTRTWGRKKKSFFCLGRVVVLGVALEHSFLVLVPLGNLLELRGDLLVVSHAVNVTHS
jgi:hypothetical protein